MNTKLVSCLLVAAALATNGARAQTVPAAPPAPAPVTPAAEAAAPLAPNQLVYSARLPGVNELTNIAAAQGLAIERIVQTPTQITAVYKYAGGQTNTVAYLLLPNAANATGQAVAPASPAPTVYYAPPPRVVYYDDYAPSYYYADRAYWYPPVSLSLGFGFRGGGGFHGGGGFRGGGHHGR
jgi:hypothetical protein